jgi:hypothetical protein
VRGRRSVPSRRGFGDLPAFNRRSAGPSHRQWWSCVDVVGQFHPGIGCLAGEHGTRFLSWSGSRL